MQFNLRKFKVSPVGVMPSNKMVGNVCLMYWFVYITSGVKKQSIYKVVLPRYRE